MADSVSKPSAEIVTEESSEEKLLHTKEQNDDVVQKPSKLQAKENARKKRFEKRMRFQPKSVLESVDDLKYYEELVDKKKGQRVNTPETLLAMEYACGHAEELESMLKALKQHSGNKTAMQTLPFRLRRRAASHNSKRLPQRLRDLAKKQNEKSENKVVTRRKRRRNINLQNEYARRAGKQGWLETHLWHSKRFQMSSSEAHFAEWGCRVALRSYDKTFRTSYRAVAKHCTIQDLSFFKFVEVTSPEKILLKFLKSVTLDFEWSRLSELPTSLSELEFLFFDKHCEPAQCVGPVNVMLAPVCQVNDLKRTMWLWLHPVLLRKLMTLLENFKENNEIEINEISKTLNRFRLTGPKSSVTLMSVLKSYKMNLKVDKGVDVSYVDKLLPPDHKNTENKNFSAVKSWMSEHQELVEKQHSIFTSTMKKCHDVHFSPDEESSALPCGDGHVYCYVTNDPRLTLPLIKTPSLITAMEPIVHENVDELSRDGTSPLWNSALRSEVSSLRLPDHVVSTRKCNAKFLSEKEKKKQMNSLHFPVPEPCEVTLPLPNQYGHCRDVYSFGVLLNDFFSKVQFSTAMLKDVLQEVMDDMTREDYENRPSMKEILTMPIFKSAYISIIHFLQSITLRSSLEKENFFKSLISKLDVNHIFAEVIGRRIVPLLLTPIVLAEQTAVHGVIKGILTPASESNTESPIRTIEDGLLPESVFARYVIPKIVELFKSRLIHVRLVLLENFSKFIHLFEKSILNDIVLPEVLTGLHDANNQIVQYSLHALADSVAVVGADVIVGEEREKIFSPGVPKFDGRALNESRALAYEEKIPARKKVEKKTALPTPRKPTLLELAMLSKHSTNERPAPTVEILLKQKQLAHHIAARSKKVTSNGFSPPAPPPKQPRSQIVAQEIHQPDVETWASSSDSDWPDINDDLYGDETPPRTESPIYPFRNNHTPPESSSEEDTTRHKSRSSDDFVPYSKPSLNGAIEQLGDEYEIKVDSKRLKSASRINKDLDFFADMEPDIKSLSRMSDSSLEESAPILKHSMRNGMGDAPSLLSGVNSAFQASNIEEDEKGWSDDSFNWN